MSTYIYVCLQVLSAADAEAVPVGEGSLGGDRQGDGAEAQDEGRAGPLLHHLRGRLVPLSWTAGGGGVGGRREMEQGFTFVARSSRI